MPDVKEQLSPLFKEFSSALSFAADFKDYFRQILEFLKKMKTENKEEMTAILTTMKNMADKMEEENTTDMETKKKEMMAYCEKEIAYMEKEHKEMMSAMDKKMSEVKDGLDADKVRVIENASKMAITEVLKQIPSIETIEADLPKLGDSIASALELLPEGDKLKLEAIRGLKEELEELRKLRTQRLGGGGFSKIAMDYHIIDAETPTGTINGVNKDFTLANIPNPTASLKVYRGGARQKLTEDYTLSSKTISFIVAPVAGEIIICDYQI